MGTIPPLCHSLWTDNLLVKQRRARARRHVGKRDAGGVGDQMMLAA
jgi:hypothetical protein